MTTVRVAAFAETLPTENAIVIRYQQQRPSAQPGCGARDLEDRLQQLADAAAGDEVRVWLMQLPCLV